MTGGLGKERMSGRDYLFLGLEMLDRGQVLSKSIADGLEFWTVADIAHPMIDDVHDEFGLFGVESEPFGIARLADELARTHILEPLNFTASRFVTVHGADVDVVWTFAVKTNDLVFGGETVLVSALVGLRVRVF